MVFVPNTAPARPRSVGHNWVPTGVYADGRNDNAENYTGRYTVTWTLADPWDGGQADYFVLLEQDYNNLNHYWELPPRRVVGNTVDNNFGGYRGTYAYPIEKFLPSGQTYSYQTVRYLVEACNTHGCSSQQPSVEVNVILGELPPVEIVHPVFTLETTSSGTRRARYSWREELAAKRYVVSRSFGGHPAGADETIYDGPFPREGVVDPDLCAGIYSYEVRACNARSCGGRRDVVRALRVQDPRLRDAEAVYDGKDTVSPVIAKNFDSGTYYYRVRSRSASGATHRGYMRGAQGVSTRKP